MQRENFRKSLFIRYVGVFPIFFLLALLADTGYLENWYGFGAFLGAVYLILTLVINIWRDRPKKIVGIFVAITCISAVAFFSYVLFPLEPQGFQNAKFLLAAIFVSALLDLGMLKFGHRLFDEQL